MKRKALRIFLSCTVITGVLFLGFATTAICKDVHLSIGAVTSSSGYYGWCVAQAQVVTKYAPGINVTLVGTGGGAYAMVKQMINGVIDWTGMGTSAVPYNVYYGKGPFKGKAWEPIRLFFMREEKIYRMYARADSGVKTWADLAGKRFNGGTPGSTDERYTAAANEALGTGIKLIPGTVPDAIKGIKEKRLVGCEKSSPTDRFDAGMLSLHFRTPLTIIGFTKEQADKIRAKNPLILFRETPAGSIKELPELGSMWEMKSTGLTLTSSRLPEEVGYQVIKAIYEHWDEIAQVHPPLKLYDPIADLIKAIPPGMETPLHAGVVRYAKEIGIKVPEAFIPPEYKGPN